MYIWRHFKKTISNEKGSWVATAIALTVVSAGVSAYGAYSQGQSQKKMYKYQADVAERQAQLEKRTAEQNITATQTEASMQAKQLKRNVAAIEGEQKGMLAAQGIGGGSVTAADIAASTFETARLDEMAIRYNADYKSWALKTGADISAWNLENQGGQYLMAAKNAATAGNINMTSSILQGATSVANIGLLAKKGK